MKCPKCGVDILENNKFCRNCGEPVDNSKNSEIDNKTEINHQNANSSIQTTVEVEKQLPQNEEMQETTNKIEKSLACPKCGTNIQENWNFCPKCHSQLNENVTKYAPPNTTSPIETIDFDDIIIKRSTNISDK